jgi:hypothetical protein
MKILVRKPAEKKLLGDLEVDEMILLKWHLKKSVEGNVQDSPDTT